MIDRTLYQETFAHLHASEEAKQEVLEQMENQVKRMKRRPLRVAGLAAAIVAALCVTAGAVNAATGGELFRVFSVTWSAKDTLLLEDEAGNQVTAKLAEGTVEQVDGRLILKALGQEVDITDALERDGRYQLDGQVDGSPAAVVVTGDGESWTVTQTVEGGMSFSYTADEGQGLPGEDGGDALPGTAGGSGGQSVTVARPGGVLAD